MSRFWAGASSSDSDSSSQSESDYSGDDNAAGGGGANRWAELSDESSDDDEVRVVKSGRERALETFQKHIANLRTAMKNRDYYALQTEFDELAKAMIKAKQVLAEGVPRKLVKILVDLEDKYVHQRLMFPSYPWWVTHQPFAHLAKHSTCAKPTTLFGHSVLL